MQLQCPFYNRRGHLNSLSLVNINTMCYMKARSNTEWRIGPLNSRIKKAKGYNKTKTTVTIIWTSITKWDAAGFC